MVEALHTARVRVVLLTGHTTDTENIIKLVDSINYRETATGTIWCDRVPAPLIRLLRPRAPEALSSKAIDGAPRPDL
jgi:hypothetical protein